MKRGKPPKRGRELRADPEKVRAFMRKHRGDLRRASPRSKGKSRRKVEEGPLSAAEWRRQVFVASGGRCIISGSLARDAEDRRFHAHHCVPARELRARGLFGYVWDPRNGVLLRTDVHERHESAAARVPHTALPAAVWAFAHELDELDGSEWASHLLVRLHPVRE